MPARSTVETLHQVVVDADVEAAVAAAQNVGEGRHANSVVTTDVACQAAGRMTTLAGLSQGYDLAGNQTRAYSADQATSYTYRYDHHNRLTGVYDGTNTTRKAAFTYDALGRRVEFAHDGLARTTDYYYDGVNEVVETPGGSSVMSKYYVHGVSYVDERLFMYNDDLKQPYYYALERMYSVWAMIDRTGAIVERVMYDGYGRPYIRESAGLGDMNNDSVLDSTDATRVAAAIAGTIWDPRADVNGDGVVDSKDQDSYDEKEPTWQDWPGNDLVVAQTFSDVGNWYLFQGVPHVALDASNSVLDKAPLNHHRARYADPAIGRWGTREPFLSSGDPRRWSFVPVVDDSLISLKARQRWRLSQDQPRKWHLADSRWLATNTFALLESRPLDRDDSSGECAEEKRTACGHGASPAEAVAACTDEWLTALRLNAINCTQCGGPIHDPILREFSSCFECGWCNIGSCPCPEEECVPEWTYPAKCKCVE
ncbi:MAG: dockerin type I repeat-containing protein [Phycisphaerae bacterium]